MLIDQRKRRTSDPGRRLGDPGDESGRNKGSAVRCEGWGDERGDRRQYGYGADQNVEKARGQCREQPQATEGAQKSPDRGLGHT